MTIHASHGARLVCAPRPEHLVALGVTRQAGSVPFVDRGVRVLGKPNCDGVFPTSGVNMGFAGPVASLAAKLFLRGLGMHHHGVAHDGVLKALLLIGVASDAYLAADVV